MSIQRPLFEERFEEVSVADRAPEQGTDFGQCSVSVTEIAGEAYNEQAFRYFLELERHRSELSGRPFLLLLVDVKRDSVDLEPQIDASTSRQLFSALTQCLRDTDFLGWYREQRTIGAVLTQDKNPPAIRLFEDQAQPSKLLFLVGTEIAFLGEKLPE